MSYLERIRGPQQATVTPINTASTRPASEGIHPYAAAIRQAWLDRLTDLAGRPWTQGDAWDTNCFVTARKLIELANSPWAGYSHDNAHDDYLTHAPRDHAWDQRDKCWAQAEKVAGAVMLPEPAPNAPIPDVTILTLDPQLTPDVGPALNPILDWHELFAADDEQEWIVEPILPARRMVALYSAPKVGKSLLMLEIAVAIARGTEVIGHQVDQPRRVLYVDFENDPQSDVRTRLEAMDAQPDQLENLCYLSYPSLAKFDTAQGAIDLLRHVQHYECEVVVIDTVSRAVMGEENANDTWLAFYRNTGLAMKKAGIACIRLDHSGKDREKGMRGGSAKYGDVDAVWRLNAISDETVLLECTDHRMPIPMKALTLIREDWPLRHRLVEDAASLVMDARVRETDEQLDRLQAPTEWGEKPAGKALRAAGFKVNNDALRKAIALRRLRLNMPLTTAPGAPPAHPGAPGVAAPGAPPPLGGARRTPATAPETPRRSALGGVLKEPEDPDLLVGCKSCFKPTTQGVAGTHGGLCATCYRNTGQTDPKEDA